MEIREIQQLLENAGLAAKYIGNTLHAWYMHDRGSYDYQTGVVDAWLDLAMATTWLELRPGMSPVQLWVMVDSDMVDEMENQ